MLVDLKDPETQAKVKAANIRWRLSDYEHGLELPDAKVKELGLKTVEQTRSKPKPPAPVGKLPGSTDKTPPHEASSVPPPSGNVFGGQDKPKAPEKAPAKDDKK